MTLAAGIAARAKELKGACVVGSLDRSETIEPARPDASGWSVNSKNVWYRRIDSPKLHQLPKQAIEALAIPARRQDCRHTHIFHEPEFVELKQRKETFVIATVNLEDRCSICGVRRSMATLGRKLLGEEHWVRGRMMLGHAKFDTSYLYALPDPPTLVARGLRQIKYLAKSKPSVRALSPEQHRN